MPANLEIRLNLNEELKIKTFSKLYLLSSLANLMEPNIPSFFFGKLLHRCRLFDLKIPLL